MATFGAQPKRSLGIARYIPILSRLPRYDRGQLRPDWIVAVTIASFSVPVSMAYAGLPGLPPQAGLCAGMTAPIAYALFGTSRQLGVHARYCRGRHAARSARRAVAATDNTTTGTDERASS
jgi:MFS superfamily sulfate permease-like transporter